jgi:transketolase
MSEAAGIETTAINTIRTLSMDAVQAANSGHPETAMSLAPVVYSLWQHFLSFDPDDPIWPNRDRFVLSAGHASMLLNSMLHLTGVKAVSSKYETRGTEAVSLDDIRNFRQLESRCAGHPEYRWTSGVETTTGPLGQGLATSVGMAIASRHMAARFNRPGFEIFDYNTYSLCGDGCMMEGVSSEAASLAGHLQLSNLCWIYDNNHITIEGHTDLAFSEDVATRFMAHGWNVLRIGDASDVERLDRAFNTFLGENARPTLIIVDSHIACGSPNRQDTSAAYGSPLGDEEIRLTKQAYGWLDDEPFLVPEVVREHFADGIGDRDAAQRGAWMALFESYKEQYPELADQLYRMQHRQLPEDWEKGISKFEPDAKGMPGRQAMPTLDRSRLAPASGVAKGAYVLSDPSEGEPEVILIGSGTEVSLCLEASERLSGEGVKVRVVSMPSWELFEQQSPEYRAELLPPKIRARVSVELASTFGWERYVGNEGCCVGMNSFGASAPLFELQHKFGFTAERLADSAVEQIAKHWGSA